jgi:hypothetical protein
MYAPLPMRHISPVVSLLYPRHESEDIIHIEDFQRQDHLQ